MSPNPTQILFLSLPRSACHMLEKMVFSQQDGLDKCWHPFEPITVPMWKWLEDADNKGSAPENLKDCDSQGQAAVAKWKEALSNAQANGKTLYMHEHPQFLFSTKRIAEIMADLNSLGVPGANPTIVPEDILLHAGTVPVFTIRHPVLTVPSNYRAVKVIYGTASRHNILAMRGIGWSRELYDLFVSRGIKPVVLDADDYMTSEEFVRHACTAIGLDPSRALVEWEKTSSEEKANMHPMLLAIQDTLVNSKGLVPGRASKNIDLEVEQQKWVKEFSETEVAVFHEAVEAALPHYEYLRAHRLQL